MENYSCYPSKRVDKAIAINNPHSIQQNINKEPVCMPHRFFVNLSCTSFVLLLIYIAECVNTAIAQVGITQTAPRGLPQKKPSSLSKPRGVMTSVQAEPTGHAGGAPISAKSLTQWQSAESNTPVKPLPESPPLVVKMVTVWPICLNMLSTRCLTWSTMVYLLIIYRCSRLGVSPGMYTSSFII